MANLSDIQSASLTLEEQVDQLNAALTEARRDLRACEDAHARNLSALCAIADGIVIVDLQGHITCMNPVASHLTGWEETAALGRRLPNVVHFMDQQGRALDVLSEGFSAGDEAIVSLVRRDGHVILVDGAVSPVRNHDKGRIGSVITFRNITASARLTRELAYHANHDFLTGLHNRRAFNAQLQRVIAHAAQFGNENALLYIDLDGFKSVNDRGGHVAGDELLRQLAILLRKQLRERDTVARLGGDEFAVLLEICTAKHALRVAEKIRSAIAEFVFPWHGRTFRIGASIGVVAFSDGRRSVERILGTADRMCYLAKTSGRNRVEQYKPQVTGMSAAGKDVSHRPGARRDKNELRA